MRSAMFCLSLWASLNLCSRSLTIFLLILNYSLVAVIYCIGQLREQGTARQMVRTRQHRVTEMETVQHCLLDSCVRHTYTVNDLDRMLEQNALNGTISSQLAALTALQYL